jgi:hypothetical protein
MNGPRYCHVKFSVGEAMEIQFQDLSKISHKQSETNVYMSRWSDIPWRPGRYWACPVYATVICMCNGLYVFVFMTFLEPLSPNAWGTKLKKHVHYGIFAEYLENHTEPYTRQVSGGAFPQTWLWPMPSRLHWSTWFKSRPVYRLSWQVSSWFSSESLGRYRGITSK